MFHLDVDFLQLHFTKLMNTIGACTHDLLKYIAIYTHVYQIYQLSETVIISNEASAEVMCLFAYKEAFATKATLPVKDHCP